MTYLSRYSGFQWSSYCDDYNVFSIYLEQT